MKNKLIVANLKMSMSLEEASAYLKEVNQIYDNRLVICPSNIYIPYFLKNGYRVGLQNIYYEGNYTGEISPKQAHDMGIDYVIIGHSDRRIRFHETDVEINQKVRECIRYGLHVILCIGETKEERDMLKMERVLKRQIELGLAQVEDFQQITIAYEPVWAIGTMKTPTLKDISEVASYIKQKVNQDISVLYGGSVTKQNVASILGLEEIDGVIVGKSARDVSMFLKLLEVAV